MLSGAVVLLILLTLWHSLDIRAAVMECGDGFLISGYAWLAAALIAVSIAAIVLLKSERLSFTLAVSAFIFILGAANIYVFRGLSAPDEISHYISAYKLSNRMLGTPVCDEYGRVYIRACDLYLEDTEGNLEEVMAQAEAGETSDLELKVFGQTLDESVYRVYAANDTGDKRSADDIGISCQWTVNTMPLAYLPQAVGISIARLFGLNTLWLITLGKLCNLVFYTLMCAAALRIIPEGRKILAAVMLLPETLLLAGSMSYDVYVLALSYLYIALIFNMREYGCGRLKTAGLSVLVIGALAPCKLIYALLLLLLAVLVPRGRAAGKVAGRERRAYLALVLFSLAAVGICMYAVNAATIGNYAAADERIITWADEAKGYTVSYFLHRPLELIDICYKSLLMKTGNWYATMFGLYLGNQDPVLNVPYPVIGLCSGALFITAAGSKLRLSGYGKAISLICFAAILAALMGSMLIAYTPMSSAYIEGVQGRYLLPVLPLLLMAVPGEWIRIQDGLDRSALIMLIIAECYVLIRVYATVALRIG